MTKGLWKRRRLGDVLRIRHGYAFSGMSAEIPPPAPVVVGIGNFDYAGGFRFDSTTVKRFLGDYPKEFELAPGDVLLAMTCQTPGGEILGIPGRVPDDGNVYLHNQRLGRVEIVEPDEVHLGYIFQLARWSDFNRHLFVTASGSKILHTSPSRIEDFDLNLPPIGVQRYIAVLLSALDDKIDSNRRLVRHSHELLDAMAEARCASLPSTPLGSLSGLTRGTVSPASLGGAVVDHYSLPAFDTSGRPERVPASTIMSNKIGLAGSGVLVSRLNPRTNRTWWTAPTGSTTALASTEFAVLTAETEVELGAVWLAVRHSSFLEELPRRVTGTSGSHQRVRPDDVLAIEVPDVRQLDDATKDTALSLLRLAHQRREESARLSDLRDALLPELLSGRIRVPEAAAVVQDDLG